MALEVRSRFWWSATMVQQPIAGASNGSGGFDFSFHELALV
jgi:hypothetical protein